MGTGLIITVLGYLAAGWNALLFRNRTGRKDWLLSTGILLIGATLHLMIFLNVPFPSMVTILGTWMSPFYKPIASWVMGGSVHG